MKQFVFYLNLILVIIAYIGVFVENILGLNLDCSIGFLVFLGFFQVFTSLLYTFYAIAYNRNLLALYILYWLFVILFFKFMIGNFFYMCLLIALYNLYLNYCGFSNSKFNILNHEP